MANPIANTIATFLFLAASVVAMFAFISIVVWVETPARERQARDRLALLKTIAENPGENASRVLELLRDQEEKQAERKERQEQKGYIIGGLVVAAVGVGLCVMLAVLGKGGVWTAGLIPLLIGCVLFGAGMFANRGENKARKDAR